MPEDYRYRKVWFHPLNCFY